MTNVLHIIPDGSVGGGNVNVARLVASIESDLKCSVLLPRHTCSSVRNLFRCATLLEGSYRSQGNPFSIAWSIYKARKGFRIIHAQGTRAAIGLLLVKPFLKRQKTVYTVRGYHGLQNPDRLRIKILIEKLLGRYIDHIVHVSNADRSIGQKYKAFQKNASVIPNGIDVPDILTGTKRKTDVLFLGRLVYQKDPQSFVTMARQLSKSLTIKLAGDGELYEEIYNSLQQSNHNIDMLGVLNHDQALAAIANTRIMVMTSRWEGLPTTAIEATMLGTAVYGFHIPSLEEVLGETAADVLTNERDPYQLAALIENDLAEQKEHKVAAMQKAYSFAHFRMSQMGQKYTKLYRDLLN